MSKYKRYAIVIILVTNGILISFLESFIPIPVPVPGVKLGLGNIITMIGIAFLGVRDVLFIVAVRCFVVAVLTRGVMMLAFSLTGGLLSAVTMALLYKKLSNVFSVKGISIVGALVHSTAQVVVASFVLGQFVIMYYLPVLLISAVITGFITGSIGEIAIDKIHKANIFNNEKTDTALKIPAALSQSELLAEKPEVEPKHFVPKMDSGVKFLIAVVLSVIPFFCEQQISFVLISAYLIIVTMVSGIRIKTVLTSFTAYFIVVVFPFLFGLLMSFIFYKVSGNAMFASYMQMGATVLRMFQLFLLWYIGCIYFNTTPMKSVIGLFDKLLTPLKSFGVPISEHLKVVMCVVRELTELGPEVKKSFTESMEALPGKNNKNTWISKINIKGISAILVNFIVNSFKRLDVIEQYVRQVEEEELYNYRFRLSLRDVLAFGSCIVLIVVLSVIELGYWG